MRRRDLIASAIGALVATTMAGGVAWATSNTGGVINACYSRINGNLRVLDGRNDHCRNWVEKSLSWNQQGGGQQGDPGPKGDPGPAGPPGPPGPKGDGGVTAYSLQSGSLAVTSGMIATGDLSCPTGQKPVGGGWSGGSFDVIINASAPNSDGTGWTGSLQNTSAATVNVTFYAICIGVGGGTPAPSAAHAATARPHFTLTKAPTG